MTLNSRILAGSSSIVAALATTILSVPSAQAALITFDDLPDVGGNIPIPDGYQGFNWNNFFALNAVNYGLNPSGYLNGLVSPNNVAFNGFGNPAAVIVSALSGTFDFNSVYLTGVWNDGLNITVEGYLGGVLQNTQTVVVDTTAPTQFTFNYLGIDELVFTSFGGTNVGFGGEGTQFAMDNLEVNAVVPEPLTMLGAGAAVAFGAAFKRRKA